MKAMKLFKKDIAQSLSYNWIVEQQVRSVDGNVSQSVHGQHLGRFYTCLV